MDETPFIRTEMLFGKAGMERLYAAKVAVFGLGGVGGYAVEALARSGVGRLDLFDHDKICPSNINRQIYATTATLGRLKVEVAKERVHDINPSAAANAFPLFYLPETAATVDLAQYDYIVDAIDNITAKIELAVRAHECGARLISAMGAGNKIDATAFVVADIYETSVCPLAKIMRRELRKRGVPKLKVVYSREEPIAQESRTPGSNAFVPPAMGLIIAGEVVKDVIQ
ncbi:MAG: tRNA threonylcarbamoyladenosine dehydratase [Lachnospiraceae bacterium]|nr:tRNA threonylcarbamoyladenosine dehydratase [Lachnospiraceae bacterium]